MKGTRAARRSTRTECSRICGCPHDREGPRRRARSRAATGSVGGGVTGIAAILASHAHIPIANLTISNLKLDGFNELTAIITVMLVILAAVNTTFIGWATVAGGRFSSAFEPGSFPGSLRFR